MLGRIEWKNPSYAYTAYAILLSSYIFLLIDHAIFKKIAIILALTTFFAINYLKIGKPEDISIHKRTPDPKIIIFLILSLVYYIVFFYRTLIEGNNS